MRVTTELGYSNTMPRHRAVAITLHDDQLLVMYRRNTQEYFVFPGGGIDDGELPEQATIREMREETSIDVLIDRLLYKATHSNGDVHYFYSCVYKQGEPHIQEGTNEHADIKAGRDFYEPRWLPVERIAETTLYPIEIRDRLVSDLEHGFDANVVEFSLQSV